MLSSKQYYNVQDRSSIECHNGAVVKLNEEHVCFKKRKQNKQKTEGNLLISLPATIFLFDKYLFNEIFKFLLRKENVTRNAKIL